MKVILLLLLLCAVPAGAEIYTWKQGGVSHYTNQPDTIPPRYRGRAKVLDIPGEGKKETGAPAQGVPSPTALPMPPPPPAAGAAQVPARQEDTLRRERRGRRAQEDE